MSQRGITQIHYQLMYLLTRKIKVVAQPHTFKLERLVDFLLPYS